mmetsp:Transcript_17967/g.51808  ORF Transcript_17967/g.51808 Transcript_17967/m.51808 type:complete len:216 (-) Transcript_17967:4118-4765(-)
MKSATTSSVASISERRNDQAVAIPDVLVGVAEEAVCDPDKQVVHTRLVRILLDKVPQLHQPIEVVGLEHALVAQLHDRVLIVNEDDDQRLQGASDQRRDLRSHQLHDVDQDVLKLRGVFHKACISRRLERLVHFGSPIQIENANNHLPRPHLNPIDEVFVGVVVAGLEADVANALDHGLLDLYEPNLDGTPRGNGIDRSCQWNILFLRCHHLRDL